MSSGSRTSSSPRRVSTEQNTPKKPSTHVPKIEVSKVATKSLTSTDITISRARASRRAPAAASTPRASNKNVPAIKVSEPTDPKTDDRLNVPKSNGRRPKD